jgi:excisionase family DNA binding protein
MSEIKPTIIIFNTDDLENAFLKALDRRESAGSLSKFDNRMTRSEAARFLGVTYVTIGNWIKRGLIHEHGIGGKKFFYREELIEILKRKI